MENDTTEWLVSQLPETYIAGDGARESNRQREYRESLEAERADIELQERLDLINQAQRKIAARAITENSSWKDSALCSALDPNIFDIQTHREAALARAICNACRVSAQCAESVISESFDSGTMMWGGMTRKDIETARKRRRIR